MLGVLAVLAAVLGVASAGKICDPAYECKYFFDAGTDLWKWDFSDSCNEGEEFLYEVPNRADNLAYHMQLCGIADHKCAPGSPYTTGTVLQTYDTEGGSACQVLGQGAPIFSAWPMDANNIPTGLNITFRGAPPIVGETTCDFNPVTEAYDYRHSVFQLKCDYSVPMMVVDTIVEGPTCFYNIYGRSKHACPETCNNM
ncbi:hypothetical protein FNF31_04142 [Cafeteria roenbergensis]|uniref:Uncharacterized protein n=1 Tax=Cafeteria roenbergensis TaxID=33653 RepID=A0A5A8C1X4_CAFRO|nr:hypothetical protein FNF28_07730 [Cafeteria roenbergensis]KAA0160758.1 hypothetical protein FNF31_04142 [Cafeteria roenbergensis]